MHEREGGPDVIHPRCDAPIDFVTLIEYWFGELSRDDETQVEEHFLGCAHCTERLEELAELASGIRAAFRRGIVRAVISKSLLDKMKNEGLRLREYQVSPGGSVRCTISATDDVVVGRLQVPRSDAARVDLVRLNERGEIGFHLRDIPFDPTAGEVLFCPSAAALKKMPAHTDRIQLLAVDESGEHLIADYTFVHTPS